MSADSTVCPHGSLRRQCEVCERDEEIARLRDQLRLANINAGLLLAQSTDADVENRELRAAVERMRATERKFGTLMHELMDERDQLRAAVARLQARIDALMLEYCPDEMTAEQTAEWARHQVPHQLTAEEREAMQRALERGQEVVDDDELCPHGMPLAENVCGPCSKGEPNRPPLKATPVRTPEVCGCPYGQCHCDDGSENGSEQHNVTGD